MKFTGEQFIIGASDRMQKDHLARYNFASKFVKGKNVLDIACGSGYGSKFLLDAGANSVTGVDVSPEAIKFAKENYATSGLNYEIGDISNFDKSVKYDVIVSFETIEHVDDYMSSLRHLYNLLKEDGILILSTPNRPISSPKCRNINDKPGNPYHIREFSVGEMAHILRGAGFIVEKRDIFGQRQQKYFKNYYLGRLYKKIFKPDLKADPRVLPLTKQPRFMVIVARKSKLTAQMSYDDYWQLRGKSKYRPRFGVLASWISPKSSVLEIGCGDGFFGEYICKNKNTDYLGVDVSSEAIQALQKRGLKGEVLDVGKDLAKFKDEQFDYVVMSEFIEHIVYSEEVLLEASRIAKKAVLVTIPNIAYWKWRLQLLFGNFPKQYAITPREHVRFWSLFDFLTMVRKLGLKVIKYKSSNGKKYLRDIFPNLFGFQICFIVKKK